MCIVKYLLHLLLQITLKVVHLISIIGNQGTLTRSIEQIITNIELLYHILYLIFCFLGIFMHPFFYSVLVSDEEWVVFYSFFLQICNKIVTLSFLLALWCGLPRGDFAQCNKICNSKWKIYHTHGCASLDFSLHVFHHWFYVL